MVRTKQKPRTRTYARNRKARGDNERSFETDGVFLLKLIICVLLGMFWLKFSSPLHIGPIVFGAIPIGGIIALILVPIVEKHQSDRKLWYTILIVVMIVSFFYPSGVTV